MPAVIGLFLVNLQVSMVKSGLFGYGFALNTAFSACLQTLDSDQVSAIITNNDLGHTRKTDCTTIKTIIAKCIF